MRLYFTSFLRFRQRRHGAQIRHDRIQVLVPEQRELAELRQAALHQPSHKMEIDTCILVADRAVLIQVEDADVRQPFRAHKLLAPLVDLPVEVAGDPWAYRAFVHGSAAEFMVAKNLYVETNSGWISDRTLCYLASGKPAVVQDTGPISFLPEREGLLRFSTLDEAASALEEVNADYERHGRAARRIAETCFDAGRVAERILEHLPS